MPYNLEKTISKRTKIYEQLYNYYYFCEHTRRLSPTTMASKTYTLNNFAQTTRLRDLRKVTNEHIYYWINVQTMRSNSGRSINDRLAHLRAMLRWQKEMNLPMPKLRLALIPKVREAPARKVCFTRAEVQRVLNRANLEEWLMIRLAFDCGLRISELQQLRVQNLHAERLTIIGKGQKRRYAYLAPDVQRQLESWIKCHHLTQYIWPSPIAPDQPLAICTIRERMQEAFRRVGLMDFCPHDLRHSYATDLKRIGIPTRKIQAGLGHASEAVTERYLSDLDGLDLGEVYRQKYATYTKSVENFYE